MKKINIILLSSFASLILLNGCNQKEHQEDTQTATLMGQETPPVSVAKIEKEDTQTLTPSTTDDTKETSTPLESNSTSEIKTIQEANNAATPAPSNEPEPPVETATSSLPTPPATTNEPIAPTKVTISLPTPPTPPKPVTVDELNITVPEVPKAIEVVKTN